jgi:hypothetical protein
MSLRLLKKQVEGSSGNCGAMILGWIPMGVDLAQNIWVLVWVKIRYPIIGWLI